MSTVRRNSSEVSVSEAKKAIEKLSEEEKGKAKGHLYSILFSYWQPYVAIIPSIITGSGNILLFFVMGKIINHLSQFSITYQIHKLQPVVPVYDPMPKVLEYVYYMIGLGVILGIARFFDVFMWIRIGSALSTKVRSDLFKNMMRSEVTFFDVNPIGSILKLLLEDAQQVQDSFGNTKGTQVANISQFIIGIILGFVYSWRLALILLALFPAIGIIMGIFLPFVSKYSKIYDAFNAKCMTIAEETLGAMRTVRGFNSEDHEMSRFERNNVQVVEAEQKVGYYISGMMSMIMILIWGAIVALLYYGATFVEKNITQNKSDFLIGDLMSFFGFCMFGCMGVMMLQGSLTQEERAISAGARIIKLSEHVPSVQFEGGIEPKDFAGHIEFKNVTFRYPTRDQNVLVNASFEVLPNQIVALVGHSGSGKSTCIQLIERFYDVNDGLILIDGHDIKEYNPRWLHRQIGLVQQEPTLFSSSIKENIKYGCSTATDEEIFAAADVANASKFINKFEKKYDTTVGEKGSSLSGGQRQRIAIARAVIKNPVILMTDEATSALDSNSEKKVQEALNKVMKDRTSIVVAHRLSTIRNANVIYVFDQGQIKESGSHEELVAKKGFYFNLISKQLSKSKDGKVVCGDSSDIKDQSSQQAVESNSSSTHSKNSSESSDSQESEH